MYSLWISWTQAGQGFLEALSAWKKKKKSRNINVHTAIFKTDNQQAQGVLLSTL